MTYTLEFYISSMQLIFVYDFCVRVKYDCFIVYRSDVSVWTEIKSVFFAFPFCYYIYISSE